ncbi:hypothetical protein PHLCEN_2v1698 [Hermanssonia centrifuga]|uniref:Uncharacterized protein n=1 Tax=Hermanssonia centrifuga TaxID=98765 RepID=A0A2R6RZA9_9APHY|nr:hypothetical protein PHLCEN_2v1698 [Hermanssonia centrifuga]
MEELSRLLKFELGTVEAFPIRSPTRWSMYVTYPDVAVSTDGSSLTKLKSGIYLERVSVND